MLLQSTKTLAIDSNSLLHGMQKDGKDTVVSIKELSSQLKRIEELKIQQGTEEERRRMLSWLSPLTANYESKHQRLIEDCSKYCAQWFLESEEFCEWSKGIGFQLKCYGDAGSGKVRDIAQVFTLMNGNSATPRLRCHL
jgi:hypothetical protein